MTTICPNCRKSIKVATDLMQKSLLGRIFGIFCGLIPFAGGVPTTINYGPEFACEACGARYVRDIRSQLLGWMIMISAFAAITYSIHLNQYLMSNAWIPRELKMLFVVLIALAGAVMSTSFRRIDKSPVAESETERP